MKALDQASGPPVFLDYAAGGPPRDVVLGGHSRRARHLFYNPHATSSQSEQCRREIQVAERRLLDCLGIDPAEASVVWASGGTEALNLAILGCLREARGAYCCVESSGHPAIRMPAREFERNGGEVGWLPVTEAGQLILPEPAPPEAGQRRDPGVVAVCHVNNETGSVQDLVLLRRWLDRTRPGGYLVVDALQSFTKLPIPWGTARIDLLAVGGRKIGGPPAVGALIVRRGTPLQPVLHGGGQQNGLRGGTLDTVGIVELVAAAEAGCGKREQEWQRLQRLNRRLRTGIRAVGGPEMQILSADDASPYILSVSFPGYEGAVLMRMLAEQHVVVATGSACSAESGGVSHVLEAMGLSRKLGRGAMRISTGFGTTNRDVDRLLEVLPRVLQAY